MHDSFPHALELSKMGYNAFALIYRPGAQTAYEDLARAIAIIFDHADDQFGEILQRMKAAHTIVIGSPVYWHNICGSVRNLLDRFYGPVEEGELTGRKLVFLYQGAAPEKWMLDAGEYTMSRFAMLYGMEYLGMASNAARAKALAGKV